MVMKKITFGLKIYERNKLTIGDDGKLECEFNHIKHLLLDSLEKEKL